MSAYQMLLSRLRGVRPAAPRQGQAEAHRACCPICQPEGPRAGRDPALSLARNADDVIVIKCFKTGCPAPEVLETLGMQPADLFPAGPGGRGLGAPGAWMSAGALADELVDVALRAALGDEQALWDVQRLARDFKAAAREAMRGDARRGAGGRGDTQMRRAA